MQDQPILPIHLAAKYRKKKSLQCLLEAGADPKIRWGICSCSHVTLHQNAHQCIILFIYSFRTYLVIRISGAPGANALVFP